MINRRDFLATVGALAGVAACRTANSGGGKPDAAPRHVERVGIQLYSVRQQMRADMSGTLAAIAAMGYQEVEFAGYFGRTAAQVRELLDANKLASPSTHIGFDAMKANWDKTFDDALAIGQQYITVPSPPNGTTGTVAAWQKVSDDFNAAGVRAKARGLTLAYHNHGSELKPVDGTSPFEVLLARTDPKYVSIQMDVFWTVSGGGDPIALFKRFPDRFVMLHIKDSSGAPEHRQVDLGAGTVDFAAILKEDAARGRSVKHVFVEHDQPADPMQFARTALDYMKRLEY